MKRKFLIAWILIVLSVSFFSCSSPAKKEEKTSASPKNDLPNITLSNLEGESFNAKNLKGNTVLILFRPDCDHCQRESKQIQEHLKAFEDYSLYFISSDIPQKIKKFSEDYKLGGFENVHFTWAENQGVLTSFGSVPTPSLYVYDNTGKLMAKFMGETSIDVILKSL